jgi:hypothetical protein
LSGKVIGQIWELDLPHDRMLVMLALADHADHEGENVYPGVGLIAWKTGYSERQVQRIMKKLIECGLLVPVGISELQTVKYKINIEAGKPKEPRKRGDKMSPRQNVTGDKKTEGGVTNCREGGDIAMSPKPSYKNVNKTSYRQKVSVPDSLVEFDRILKQIPAYKPTKEFYEEVESNYSELPLRLEATKMVGWLQGQKKRKGTIAFVLNWLGNSKDRAETRNNNRYEPEPNRPPPVSEVCKW